MTAIFEVTLITAMWTQPEIFSGVLDVRLQEPPIAAKYTFRVEVSADAYRFTTVDRADVPGWSLLQHPDAGAALNVLAFAIRETVTLLRARETARFALGQGQPLPPATLG